MLKKETMQRVVGIKPDFYETPRMLRLSKALICLEDGCECIFTKNENKIGSANVSCPACGSHSVHFLAKFLNR